MALFDDKPRSATVTAIEDTTVLKIGKEEFYEILEERAEITRTILKVMAGRLRETLNHV